jgi:N-acetylglutamate synthase-like GNAT family acetyltransferase
VPPQAPDSLRPAVSSALEGLRRLATAASAARDSAGTRLRPYKAPLGRRMNGGIKIRRELRPGDLGALIALHGRLIPPEHGLDSTHEGYVAASVARAAIRGWPREREAAWIVENDGKVAGGIALTDDGEDTAGLRWFVLEPCLRGRGLGRRLVRQVVAEARRHGFARVRLETFSDLRAAGHLYREHGFELVHEETGPRWGREQVTYQHYELQLNAA